MFMISPLQVFYVGDLREALSSTSLVRHYPPCYSYNSPVFFNNKPEKYDRIMLNPEIFPFLKFRFRKFKQQAQQHQLVSILPGSLPC